MSSVTSAIGGVARGIGGIFSGPKAPAPPDPYATSAAQTQSNIDTAAYNASVNRYNQYSPFGSQVWSQGAPTTDPATGKLMPNWSSTVSLSPEAQQQLDASNRARMSAFGSAENLANQNYDYSPESFGAQRQQVVSDIQSRMEPQFQRDEEAMRTRLANQGITDPGSTAYQNEYRTFNNAKNDARIQADLAGGQEQTRLGNLQSQGIGNQTAIINALNGAAAGTQASMPQFNGAPPVNAQGTDIAGAINNTYQGQLANQSNQTAARNNLIGSAAQLAGMYYLGRPA